MASKVRQFQKIYNKKKVLITGQTGFKGSWLALWLSTLGADVVGYSIDTPTQPSHFEILHLNVKSVTGNILDKGKILNVVLKHKPEIIFHLAAQPIVRRSYRDPVETFETNVMGTVNVLECCRKVGTVKAVVNITSDKCYQNTNLPRGYREDDPLGGDDPYSASKGAAEVVSNAYRKAFFNPESFGKQHSTLLANVRAGNVIGGGDWAEDRLIPDIVRATSLGNEVVIRNPNATRPWQHVLEPLSGYLHLGWKLLEGRKEFSDNWNFGPEDGSNLTVLEVVKRSKEYWGAVRFRVEGTPDGLREANLLMLDSSKARSKLRWKNVWNSATTFERTFAWYRNYYEKSKIDTAEDVAAYVRDAQHASLEWVT